MSQENRSKYSTSKHSTTEEILDQVSREWDSYSDQQYSSLFRRALLRDLIRVLHAQRSVLMASKPSSSGRSEKLSRMELSRLEDQVQMLREHPDLQAELSSLLSKPLQEPKPKNLPAALADAIGETRLERPDRIWERALAIEAFTLGWRFWKLSAWIRVSSADSWQKTLEKQMKRQGILLFTESGPNSPRGEFWEGAWYICLAPHVQADSIVVGEFSGTGNSPETFPPQWTLLLAPTRR